MKKNLYIYLVFLAVSLALIHPGGIMSPLKKVCAATTCSTPNTQQNSGKNLHWPPNSPMTLYIDPKFSPDEQKAIKSAANAWQAAGAFSQVSYTSIDPGLTAGNGTISIMQGKTQTDSLASTSDNIASGSGSDPSVLVGANIIFDPSYMASFQLPNPTPQDPNRSIVYSYKAYSPGQANGGYAFLTLTMEHEIGHALGLDDNHDANGKKIDYQDSTAMGFYAGTNNQGIAPGTYQGVYTSGVESGHLAGVTDCDKAVVLANQVPPDLSGSDGSSDKGGTTVPQNGVPTGDGGGGGSNPCTEGGGGISEYDPSCNCFHAYVNCS